MLGHITLPRLQERPTISKPTGHALTVTADCASHNLELASSLQDQGVGSVHIR